MKLRTVELGRGIAACAVVAFHANATANYIGLSASHWASPLQLGVDFFFVLSGFIIFYVHREESAIVIAPCLTCGSGSSDSFRCFGWSPGDGSRSVR